MSEPAVQPRPEPPTAGTAQTTERFLSEAATRGELAASKLRIYIVAAALVNLTLLSPGGRGLLAGSVKYWTMALLLVFGIGYSARALWRLRRQRAPPLLVETSVAVDALVVFGVVGSSVVWPSETYRSLVGIPHSGAFAMVLAASGFRLSERAVWLAGALNGGAVAALLGWDWLHNPGARETPLDDYAIFLFLLALGFGVARTVVKRTHRLVAEGAESALQAERAQRRLGVYLSPEVAAALEGEALRPSVGERRAVAVLFSDLRGFTRYGEKLPPEQLVGELNAYLDAMVQVIREEGGVVDKYIGDAIMVVFGLLEPGDDDAARALRTAWKMQRALEDHNARRAAVGLPRLRQGIGVHYGEAVAGNIGTDERLQFTVVGDAVNLASRLEQATKRVGAPVLVSRDAVNAAGDEAARLDLQSCGTIRLKGREAPMEVFGFGVQRNQFG